MSSSLAIARRHVTLSLTIKRLAESKGFAGSVYIATHALRRAAPFYRQSEHESGENFWSIKAWMPSSPREVNLKDPDLIIAEAGKVKFFIEVKWGTISGIDTDLKLSRKERSEIGRLLGASAAYCNVNGPVHEPPSRRQKQTFWLDEKTRFIFATEISAASRSFSLLDAWEATGFQVTNIAKRIGRFSSFEEVFDASE